MKRTEPLEFHQPTSLAEATRIMLDRGPGGHFLAGGTDLVIAMKEKGLCPNTWWISRRYRPCRGSAKRPAGALPSAP